MAFKPISDRVVIRITETGEKSQGGVILPGSTGKKFEEAIVLSVGPGRRDEQFGDPIDMDVRVGDRVLVSKHAGMEIEVDGKPAHLVREAEILGIIE